MASAAASVKGKVLDEFAGDKGTGGGETGGMAEKMQAEMEALEQAFMHFDKDRSGYLDKKEFKDVLTQMGSAPMTDTEFKAVWKNIDEDKDGKIDYNEFIQWLLL